MPFPLTAMPFVLTAMPLFTLIAHPWPRGQGAQHKNHQVSIDPPPKFVISIYVERGDVVATARHDECVSAVASPPCCEKRQRTRTGRGPDAGRTIEVEETDADRTRAW
eukprot:gene16699-biopygen12829